jgi:hypothetical protein
MLHQRPATGNAVERCNDADLRAGAKFSLGVLREEDVGAVLAGVLTRRLEFVFLHAANLAPCRKAQSISHTRGGLRNKN